MIKPVIQMHHDGVFAGHQGIKRTRFIEVALLLAEYEQGRGELCKAV
jgi:hypothetical protein